MARLVLGIDTCGASGFVALARMGDGSGRAAQVELMSQTELAARSYSATLITAIEDLLVQAGYRVAELDVLVAVSGPGSFTGVRVCLGTVKGLAEPERKPVVTVSRLEVLAAKAGAAHAVLDAHRGKIFLRIADGQQGGGARELLAGKTELAAMASPAGAIAVCGEAAAALLETAWPGAELKRVSAPTALDAIGVAAPRVLAGSFADLALLDGHYLRRPDAEILGEKPEAGARGR